MANAMLTANPKLFVYCNTQQLQFIVKYITHEIFDIVQING